MRVLVTGGTGFVGPAIVRAIVEAGHEATVLVHRRAGPFDPPPRGVRVARGDVTKPDEWRDAARGHDALVHLVAIRRAWPKRGLTFDRLHVEATASALAVAKSAGIRRYLHMSASGVPTRASAYLDSKWRAEELVRASGLAWTIFRPTFVVGPPEREAEGFDQEFARIVRKAPVLPSFRGGKFAVEPVARKDVALAFARALDRPVAVGKTYLLAGPDKWTWNEYLRNLAKHLGKRRVLAPVPRWLVLPVAGMLERFRWFPASKSELASLMVGHGGDASEAARDLGIAFAPWREAIREAVPAR